MEQWEILNYALKKIDKVFEEARAKREDAAWERSRPRCRDNGHVAEGGYVAGDRCAECGSLLETGKRPGE